MTLLAMHPVIKVSRENETYVVKNEHRTVTLTEDSDLFFNGSSLRHIFDEELNHEFDIEPSNPNYKYCNDLLTDRCDKKFVIYDCEFDRWLCIDESGEVEWTTTYDDKDIAFFNSLEEAEEMIFDDTDGYAIQVRFYPHGELK